MARTTWPDGEPRLGPDDLGSVGGLKNGHASRRADGWENSDAPSIGWLDGTAAAKSDPQGTAYTPIGPGSSAWSANRNGPFTTGDQSRRRKR
jgi:hypothetical protein